MKIIILGLWALIFCSNLQFTNAGSNLRTSFDQFRVLTNQFLKTIQPNTKSLNLSISLISNVTSGKPVPADYMYYINSYSLIYLGYIILIIIGILFFVFFTCFGMFFCCCRVCCGKCGAKTEAVYNMKRKRIAFNICLFIFTSLILTGAIVSMASNFVFRDVFSNSTTDNDGNLIYNFNATMNKAVTYINALKTNISGPGLNLIANLASNANSLLSPISKVFIDIFKAGISFDSLISNAYLLTQNYVNLQTYSKNLSDIASRHQTQTNDFTSYLNALNSTLAKELTSDNCVNVTCTTVLNQMNSLMLGFNITNINYIADKSTVDVTNSYSISNLNNSISTITNNVANVTNDANTTFMNNINSFINNLNTTTLIANLNNTLNVTLASATTFINELTNNFLNFKFDNNNNKTISGGFLYDYVSYGFYGFCALISIILLVVLLFYVGLCFGICGAPNFEDASCCNKGKGGGFLMAAVAFSFIFGWILMLITMIMFVVGGLANTEICRVLTPSNSDQTMLVDSVIVPYLKNVTFGPISLSNINFYQSLMLGCPNSPNLISAFKLSDSFMASIVTYTQTNFIDSQINQTISSISNYNVSPINTADLDSNLNDIDKVMNRLMAIVSIPEQNELKKSVIALDSQLFRTNVNQLASALNSSGKGEVGIRIQDAIAGLISNITAMTNIQTLYYDKKKQFDDNILLIINTYLKNVKDSLSLLKTQPSNARNKAVLAAADSLRSIVKNTINGTLYDLFTIVGDCKGISNAVMSGVNMFCVIILGPFNNIWMGIGWFLLFIIPAIIFAVKLTGIYRITHVETESAAYNHAYMSSNQFLNKDGLEMIKMGRPQKV